LILALLLLATNEDKHMSNKELRLQQLDFDNHVAWSMIHEDPNGNMELDHGSFDLIVICDNISHTNNNSGYLAVTNKDNAVNPYLPFAEACPIEPEQFIEKQYVN
tara:strand:- start:660 stop:974 length:315 start_codon:yes stop_codon:yes gene_type:complete